MSERTRETEVRQPAEATYFDDMSESAVMEVAMHLHIDKRGRKLLATYFAYKSSYDIQTIAGLNEMAAVEAESILLRLHNSIKSDVQNGVPTAKEKLAAYMIRAARPADLRKMQEIRETNTRVQENTMNGATDYACNGIAVGDMDSFSSDTSNVQQKMIEKYCSVCPIMEACALDAVESRLTGAARGGLRSEDLENILKGSK